MHKRSEQLIKKSALALAISLALPTLAAAQTIPTGLALEEIIVTAQKRSQSLQDVPVSVSVVSGQSIKESGIANLEEMSAFVPNLSVNEGSQTVSISMRGLGSGINQGLEQSVGMFVDGIYAGRDRQFRSAFMDLEAVEVLRGPQGTLFGKNTIAGALSVKTAKPSEEFEASLQGSYEPENDEYTMQGIVSGQIADTLYGRLAVKHVSADGFMQNTMSGFEEPSKRETVARATLVWEPTDDLSVMAKYETGSSDSYGDNNRIDANSGWQQVFESVDADYVDNDSRKRSTDLPDFSLNNNESLTINVDYALGDYTLTSITGYSEYDYSDQQDVDFSPPEVLNQYQDQKFDQISQEFRLTSPLGERFEFLTGAFYQKSTLEHHKRLDADIASLAAGVPTDVQIGALSLPLNTANIVDILDPAMITSDLKALNASAGIFAMANAGQRAGRVSDFKQDSETMSVYGQGTWHIEEDLHLTLGLRYGYEKKEASRDLYLSQFGTETPMDVTDPANATTVAVQSGIFGVQGHSLQGSDTVENISPSLKLQYDLNEDVMLYGSVSRAYKSGGYSESGTGPDLESFHFEDEQALAYELGSKMSFWDGRARLNMALFLTEYKNLQVSAFVGDKYVVGNAASAISQGLEVDGLVRLTENLDLVASMAYLDATYDEFSDAACTLAQIKSSGQSAKDCTQDLSGESLTYAPEWSANLGFNHGISLGNSLDLNSRVMFNYTDEQYLAQDLDQNSLEPSHLTVSARTALSDINGQWELALVGKNLTNESVRLYGNDVPLMDGAYFSYVGMPRTLAVQFTLAY